MNKFDNILIFGAGVLGDGYAKYLIRNEHGVNVLGFIDNKLNGKMKRGLRIFSLEEALKTEYDTIAICAKNEEDRLAIFAQLIRHDVDEHKIKIIKLPEADALKYVWHTSFHRQEFIRDFAPWARENNIEGDVAECGVYRGETAKCMNQSFFDKTLYLFDTFNGFDERDIEVENTIGEQSFVKSGFNKVGHLADTTVQLVMDKMLYPKNVIIKKGWIPNTFHGMDGRFCFVHLDMDLYLPMLAGLQYFYPKISRGGGNSSS